MSIQEERTLMRRVQGYHDIRLDGMTDLVMRARGASVLDVGCNRGLVGFEMANNGATVVHGCDTFKDGIACARQLFCDLRNVESRFEVMDLSKGPEALDPFAPRRYDIVLMLAVVHKLRRVMVPPLADMLIMRLGNMTQKFLGWRATSDKPAENDVEMHLMDRVLREAGLKRVHTSFLSQTLGVAAIWGRGY